MQQGKHASCSFMGTGQSNRSVLTRQATTNILPAFHLNFFLLYLLSCSRVWVLAVNWVMWAFKVEGNVYFSLYIEVSLLPHLISELGNEANAIAVFVTGKKKKEKKKRS